MCSLSGILQRPLVAAAAVAVTSVSIDFSIRFPSNKLSGTCSSSSGFSNSSICDSLQESKGSWVSHISVSKLANLSFVSRIRVPVPSVNFPVPNLAHNIVPSLFYSWVACSPVLLTLYQSAELVKTPSPVAYADDTRTSPPDVMYRWHLPEPNSIDVTGSSDCSSAKSRTVVVLLGWLGAKQKHLKRYAEWYTSKGFHAITFTFPMAEILSYQVGGKAEEHIDLLVNHLAEWLEEEHGKNLVFHTFSNTGWLTCVLFNLFYLQKLKCRHKKSVIEPFFLIHSL